MYKDTSYTSIYNNIFVIKWSPELQKENVKKSTLEYG